MKRLQYHSSYFWSHFVCVCGKGNRIVRHYSGLLVDWSTNVAVTWCPKCAVTVEWTASREVLDEAWGTTQGEQVWGALLQKTDETIACIQTGHICSHFSRAVSCHAAWQPVKPHSHHSRPIRIPVPGRSHAGWSDMWRWVESCPSPLVWRVVGFHGGVTTRLLKVAVSF